VRLNGIEGRVALVTGAGRGIGRCIAETLRDLGAKTAAGDLEPPAFDGVPVFGSIVAVGSSAGKTAVESPPPRTPRQRRG